MDIAPGLRQRGWGRYRQRGRYLCGDGGPRFLGVEVAIGSAAVTSNLSVMNLLSVTGIFWTFAKKREAKKTQNQKTKQDFPVRQKLDKKDNFSYISEDFFYQNTDILSKLMQNCLLAQTQGK